jgi:hypothetical protein
MALTVDVHVGYVQGLGHYFIVDGKAEEVAKVVLVDVARGEQSFIGVGVAAGVIGVTG